MFEVQRWFGAAIRQPTLKADSDAARYIAPSPTLTPHERLTLYHQQYWWRLLSTLQENFPALATLHTDFNQKIGIPYLDAHPPTHWALCRLGQTLPSWLRERGFSDLDCDLAAIEAAAQRAFWCEQKEAAQQITAAQPLTLQPHVHLFDLGGDLFTFRDTLLSEKRIPSVRQGRSYFALYRNPKNQVRWKELSRGEYTFLVSFQEKTTIEAACAAMEAAGGALYREAEERLPLWFREWTFLKWLY